ncbi:MAG: YtxH domain-containing protein [Gemmatimonadota bacterium]
MDDHEEQALHELEAAEDEEAVEHHSTRTFLAGLAIGALIGAGAALLFAPQSGADTRRAVSRRAKHLAREARDHYDEITEKLRRARRAKERDDATDD